VSFSFLYFHVRLFEVGNGIMFYRRSLIGAEIEFNACHLLQQPQLPPAHSFGIGDPVAAKTLPEVFGFSNTNDVVLGIPHFVNAGVLRNLAEKLFAQPLYERLFGREQKLLAGGHGDENTPIAWAGKFFCSLRIKFNPNLSGNKNARIRPSSLESREAVVEQMDGGESSG